MTPEREREAGVDGVLYSQRNYDSIAHLEALGKVEAEPAGINGCVYVFLFVCVG